MLFNINLIFLLVCFTATLSQYTAPTEPPTVEETIKLLRLEIQQNKRELNAMKTEHKKDIDRLEAELNTTKNSNKTPNSPCGDWDVYRDEKCFKVFDRLVTEPEAEIACNSAEKGSKLATIRSSVEQQFVSNLVFKTHKIVDNVWIGAKYSIKSYKWIDNTDIGYTNWAKGKPINSTDKACVQMNYESPSTGQWIDEPCNKHGAFICQKMQTLSVTSLQENLINFKHSVNESMTQLKQNQSRSNSILQESINTFKENASVTNSKFQESINQLKNNPVPIGFIYVQLPSQSVPKSIWPTLEWKDISSDYAGLFFRAEGGGSAAFETEQSDNSPRLTSVGCVWDHLDYDQGKVMNINAGETSKSIRSGDPSSSRDYLSLNFTLSGGEVRPRNKAIRIWKRIH